MNPPDQQPRRSSVSTGACHDLPAVLPMSGICSVHPQNDLCEGNDGSTVSIIAYPELVPLTTVVNVANTPTTPFPCSSNNTSAANISAANNHSATNNTSAANNTSATGGSKIHDWETANIFVANTPAEWSENDLRVHYEPHGEIVSVRLVSQRRFGFVRFKTVEQAREAILQTDRKRPCPKIPWMLHVSMAVHDEGDGQEPNNRIFARGLPSWCTDAHLRQSVGRVTQAALAKIRALAPPSPTTPIAATAVSTGDIDKSSASDQTNNELVNKDDTTSTTPLPSSDDPKPVLPLPTDNNKVGTQLSEVDLTPVCSVLVDPQGRCKGTGFIEFAKVEAAAQFLKVAVEDNAFTLDGFDQSVELKFAERAESRAQRAARNKDRVVKHLTEKVRQKVPMRQQSFHAATPQFPMNHAGAMYAQPTVMIPFHQQVGQQMTTPYNLSPGSSTTSYSQSSSFYQPSPLSAGHISPGMNNHSNSMHLVPSPSANGGGLFGNAPPQMYAPNGSYTTTTTNNNSSTGPMVYNNTNNQYALAQANLMASPPQQQQQQHYGHQQQPSNYPQQHHHHQPGGNNFTAQQQQQQHHHYLQQQQAISPVNFSPNTSIGGNNNSTSGTRVMCLPDGTYAAVQYQLPTTQQQQQQQQQQTPMMYNPQQPHHFNQAY